MRTATFVTHATTLLPATFYPVPTCQPIPAAMEPSTEASSTIRATHHMLGATVFTAAC